MQEAPLLRQLLSSSTAEHAAERLWLVRLLAAGFRGQEEGDIFRCPSPQHNRSIGLRYLHLLCKTHRFAAMALASHSFSEELA